MTFRLTLHEASQDYPTRRVIVNTGYARCPENRREVWIRK